MNRPYADTSRVSIRSRASPRRTRKPGRTSRTVDPPRRIVPAIEQLEGRPRDGRPLVAGQRMPAAGEQSVHPQDRGGDLLRREQLAQRDTELALHLCAQAGQHVDRFLGEGTTAPPPQQGSQLVLDGEADAVVDAE